VFSEISSFVCDTRKPKNLDAAVTQIRRLGTSTQHPYTPPLPSGTIDENSHDPSQQFQFEEHDLERKRCQDGRCQMGLSDILQRGLLDSYIRAIRWASDRITEQATKTERMLFLPAARDESIFNPDLIRGGTYQVGAKVGKNSISRFSPLHFCRQ
jgi:hypothetical protein